MSATGTDRKPHIPQLRERSCREGPVPPLWDEKHKYGEAAVAPKKKSRQKPDFHQIYQHNPTVLPDPDAIPIRTS
jgi:hypothetical protein